jgi:hypothetical protein
MSQQAVFRWYVGDSQIGVQWHILMASRFHIDPVSWRALVARMHTAGASGFLILSLASASRRTHGRRLHTLAVITKGNEFVVEPHARVQPEMPCH